MKFLILNSTDPYRNLAIEEYLFSCCEDDIFMLWQNEPTVVIGRNQNAYAEIDRAWIEANGVHVARRITGGGAVYHDLGNVNYTFISSARAEGQIDFAYFTAPIIEALAALGLHAELSGRNDLLIDGKKFSGNAQHSAGGRVLHHGTMLFDSDLDALTSALRVDEEKIRAKGIKSTRSRVTNLKPLLGGSCDTAGFIARLADAVREKYHPEEIALPDDAQIEALTVRNASREWIYPERELLSRYSLRKKRRYPFGIVEVYLDMRNDVIGDVQIRGDFFGVRPIGEFEEMLRGISLDAAARLAERIDIGAYIFGMTADCLADLLCR